MSLIKTRADSLRFYLTGAASDGAAQADPNLSIGAFRSSTRFQPIGFSVATPIANVSVDFVAGANGVGAGTIVASGVDDLKWTPPGGTQGAAVTILNGETRVLEAGGAASEAKKYVTVTRTSATALTGTATVNTVDLFENVVGLDTVTSAEAAAGDLEYRCVALKNEATGSLTVVKVKVATLGTQRVSGVAFLPASGAGTIESATAGAFDDWPASGYALVKVAAGTLKEIVYYSSRTATVLTVPAAGRALLGTSATVGLATDTVDAIPGIAIALDAPTSQPTGTFEAPADEDTAPTGPTFSTPITDANALSIGTLLAGEIYGVWIKRDTPVGAVAQPNALHHLLFAFDAA